MPAAVTTCRRSYPHLGDGAPGPSGGAALGLWWREPPPLMVLGHCVGGEMARLSADRVDPA